MILTGGVSTITGNTMVETITADLSDLSKSLNEEHSIRLYSRGGHFSKDQLIPVYFLLISGYDSDDDFNNLLFGIREDIRKQARPLAFIDTPLDKPTDRDFQILSSIDRSSAASTISGLCLALSISGSSARTQIAQKALGDMLSVCGNDVFDIGSQLVCKMNLIANAIGAGQSDKIPAIFYYGIPNKDDIVFLCFAQRCGFDVICASSDKAVEEAFAACSFAEKMQRYSMQNTKPLMPFPSRMVKAKIATVAYTAERELDGMLYSGDTMFRDMQFKRMQGAVLRTTFEEIELLWDQPAKYRTGFAVKGDTVVVPTIFAKINGVKDGDLKPYWQYVDESLTPESIYIIKAPSTRRPNLNVARDYAPFHTGKHIHIEELLRSRLNKYGFLSDALQHLVLEKLQEILDDGMLTFENEQEMTDYVLYAGLNLDRSVLRLLSGFDFTKDVPKIVIVDTIEEPFSKLECTQLLIFSYLGFDILVFSPAGYRDLETYISGDAFETHNCGEFMYNLSAPRFSIPKEHRVRKKKGGFLKNLFKKGR